MAREACAVNARPERVALAERACHIRRKAFGVTRANPFRPMRWTVRNTVDAGTTVQAAPRLRRAPCATSPLTPSRCASTLQREGVIRRAHPWSCARRDRRGGSATFATTATSMRRIKDACPATGAVSSATDNIFQLLYHGHFGSDCAEFYTVSAIDVHRLSPQNSH